MNIYLSTPGFICSAGSSEEDFSRNVFSGNRDGIVQVKCGLEGENGPKFFYAGRINEKELPPVDDKFDMRFLRIVNRAINGLEDSIQKAIKKYGADRVAVCAGQCDNGSYLSFQAHKEFFGNGAFDSRYDLKAQGADYAATFIARKTGALGPALSFATACSSSASAVIKAKELIKAGLADAVIAGGADIASDTVLLGFDSLEAVDHEKTNPFSKNRNGITLGEGACFFVFARDDLDGTGIVLAGTGESSDASHMTAPLADGSGAKMAMERAIADAHISAESIDYVNLHGTGTRLNDSMEGKGVNLVFGDYKVPVSTTKAVMGHTLGAAGALELAVCFYAIKNQKLPVQVWDKVRDEDIPELNFVSEMRAADVKCCMSNSFAFGGCNASLIIAKA